MWILYICTMNVKRCLDNQMLTKVTQYLILPTVLIAVKLDVFLNWTLMTLLFLDLPKESTMTKRFKRYDSQSKGWRKNVVQYIKPLLDPFDPSGKHI